MLPRVCIISPALLQQQLQVQTEENEELKQQLQVQTEENEELKQQLQVQTEENEELKQQPQVQTEENEELKQQLQVQTEENEELKQQLQVQTEENEKFKEQLETLQVTGLQQFQALQDGNKARLEEEKARLEGLEEEKARLEGECLVPYIKALVDKQGECTYDAASSKILADRNNELYVVGKRSLAAHGFSEEQLSQLRLRFLQTKCDPATLRNFNGSCYMMASLQLFAALFDTHIRDTKMRDFFNEVYTAHDTLKCPMQPVGMSITYQKLKGIFDISDVVNATILQSTQVEPGKLREIWDAGGWATGYFTALCMLSKINVQMRNIIRTYDESKKINLEWVKSTSLSFNVAFYTILEIYLYPNVQLMAIGGRLTVELYSIDSFFEAYTNMFGKPGVGVLVEYET